MYKVVFIVSKTRKGKVTFTTYPKAQDFLAQCKKRKIPAILVKKENQNASVYGVR